MLEGEVVRAAEAELAAGDAELEAGDAELEAAVLGGQTEAQSGAILPACRKR